MKHSPTTVMAGDQPKSKNKKKKRPRFAWKVFGLTPCSKKCGGGTRFAVDFFFVVRSPLRNASAATHASRGYEPDFSDTAIGRAISRRKTRGRLKPVS